MNEYSLAKVQLMFIYVVCDAKVRTLFYIASDLSETLRMINEISPTIYQQIEIS